MAFDGCYHDNDIDLMPFPELPSTPNTERSRTATLRNSRNSAAEPPPTEGTRLRRKKSIKHNLSFIMSNSYMIDSYSRVIFPMTYLLFNIIYWSLYSSRWIDRQQSTNSSSCSGVWEYVHLKQDCLMTTELYYYCILSIRLFTLTTASSSRRCILPPTGLWRNHWCLPECIVGVLDSQALLKKRYYWVNLFFIGTLLESGFRCEVAGAVHGTASAGIHRCFFPPLV